MKKNVILVLAIATISLVSFNTIKNNSLEGVSYKLDTKQTKLTWTGKYVSDGHTHTGTVNVTKGDLTFGDKNMVSGNFVVDMKSMTNQDLPEEKKGYLLGHLNSADFFNTEKFSETKVTVNGVTDKEMMLTISVLGKDIKSTVPVTFVKTDKTLTANGKFEIDFATLEMKGTKPSDGKPADQRTDSKISFDLNLVMNK